MTRIYGDFKKMSKRRKMSIYGVLLLFIMVLVIGIKSTMAYYEDVEAAFPMLAAAVGDFDTAAGDINIVIQKQTAKSSTTYVPTYGVPSVGYSFNVNKTYCENPTTKAKVTCSQGSSGACHYTYNANTREFSLTSNQKVTCNFYFDLTQASDIDVLVYIQNDDVGDRTYSGVKYQLVNDVPTSGYTYSTYTCDNSGGTVSYSSSTHKLTVSSNSKNRCYAYFKKTT